MTADRTRGALAGVMERAGTAERLLVLACLMIAAGGVLLGLQVDGKGDLVGTGYAALAIGALVALVATLVQAAAGGLQPFPLGRIVGIPEK